MIFKKTFQSFGPIEAADFQFAYTHFLSLQTNILR
jgi:hypothetical protein